MVQPAGVSGAAARKEQLLNRAVDNGQSIMVLTPGDLVGLLRDLSGGTASGNVALGNSLKSQSDTIAAQNVQMQSLLTQVGELSKKNAELEASNLTVRQYDGTLQLARDKMVSESATHREMLGILKIAGLAIASHYMGPNGPDLSALFMGLSGAGGAAASPALQPPAPASERPATPVDGEETERPAAAPSSLAEAVKVVGQTLTPETLDMVLAAAELPNAQIPGNAPTLLAVIQILLGCLDDKTIQAVKADLGPELMQRLYMLMMAQKPSAATPAE